MTSSTSRVDGPGVGFTPGPWGIEQTTNTLWIGPLRSDGRKVDDVVASLDIENLKPSALSRETANARLIAAAPSLYEALAMSIAQMEVARSHLKAIATCNEDRRAAAALGTQCDHARRALLQAREG